MLGRSGGGAKDAESRPALLLAARAPAVAPTCTRQPLPAPRPPLRRGRPHNNKPGRAAARGLEGRAEEDKRGNEAEGRQGALPESGPGASPAYVERWGKEDSSPLAPVVGLEVRADLWGSGLAPSIPAFGCHLRAASPLSRTSHLLRTCWVPGPGIPSLPQWEAHSHKLRAEKQVTNRSFRVTILRVMKVQEGHVMVTCRAPKDKTLDQRPQG